MAATPLNPSKISKCCLVLSKLVLFSAVITLVKLYLSSIIGNMSGLQLIASKMIQKSLPHKMEQAIIFYGLYFLIAAATKHPYLASTTAWSVLSKTFHHILHFSFVLFGCN